MWHPTTPPSSMGSQSTRFEPLDAWPDNRQHHTSGFAYMLEGERKGKEGQVESNE
jgi:hypothetical protein